MAIWNPWHGCHKISPGCQNCYVYRRDESVGRDASIVTRTNDYDLPVRKNRQKEYKLLHSDGTVFACMTSDFFLEDADEWRADCWKMMKERSDLHFAVITKRIHRFTECIPEDWGDGYPNVTIFCTVENQQMADYRLPIFLNLPIRHKQIHHEPMLGPIDIASYLATGQIECVTCGGESGPKARPCNYDWILSTREQCIRYGVGFHFKQTGALFIKDGKTYRIEREKQETQAAKAGIDYPGAARSKDVPNIEVQEQPEAYGQMELDVLIGNQETSGKGPLRHDEWLNEDLFERIARSKFRSRFKLKAEDCKYIQDKGMDQSADGKITIQ